MAETDKPLWKHLREQGPVGPDDVLRMFGIKAPPVDVIGMARSLGVLVRGVSDPGWAGAVRSKDDKAVIWVRTGDSPNKQRFTVAHELGHLLLHDTQAMAFRDNNNFSGGPREQEANAFAGRLLVPLWMLEAVALNLGPLQGELARAFKVSEDVMRIRMAALDAL